MNDIEIKINFIYANDLLNERFIDYKLNDLIINDYKYIKTLGQKSMYSTYLCENKENKKVVIRKIKKSRINNSKDLFENEKYCLMKFRNNPNIINYIEFLSDENFEFIVYEYIENRIGHFKSNWLENKIINFIYNFFGFHAEKDKKMILLPILPTNILIKENFDVILLGFGFLNVYPNDSEFKGKLCNFYFNMDKYYQSKNLFMNDLYSSHIKDYFSINYNNYDYYVFNKRKFKKIKLEKIKKLEKEIEIGKLLITNEHIFSIQNNSLVVYNKNNFYVISELKFPDKEGNLLNFIVIDENILILLNKYKMYIINFEQNILNITDTIIYQDLQEKYKINYSKENEEDFLYFNSIAYIEKLNIVFTSGNTVCSWELNKGQKKLEFLTYYEYLNLYTVFQVKNIDDISLIAIGRKNFEFYSIKDKSNLIPLFKYEQEIDYYHSDDVKMFKQDKKYCYALVLGYLIIFKIYYKQKKIERIFCSYLDKVEYSFFIKFNSPNCLCPFQSGLLIGNNLPFFQYWKKYEDINTIIEYLVYLKNDKIFDIIKNENYLFVIGNNNILVFEINHDK